MVCSGSTTNCSNCTNGYYKSGTSCASCPAGYYCKNNNKTICPENNYCPQGAINPTACPQSTTSPQGSKAESDCEDEEWECEFEYTTTGKYSRKHTYKGTKDGTLCLMQYSAKYAYEENKGLIGLNLTWTPITKNHFSALCKDPANSEFAIGIATCEGYTSTVQYGSKEYAVRYTDYASSCKVDVLSCGGGTALQCHVDKYPCSNSYYKDYHMHIAAWLTGKSYAETRGKKIIFTVYSAQLSSEAGGPYKMDVSYYSYYSGSSSGNSTCNAVFCTDDVMNEAARGVAGWYIVKKN